MSAIRWGTVAALETIIPKAHAAGALVLVDGALNPIPHRVRSTMQKRFGWYDFLLRRKRAHKMCGPTGIGFLYGKRALLEAAMPPFLTGGDMIKEVRYQTTTFNEIPWKFEAGTGNIADAVGLGAAVDYCWKPSAWIVYASMNARLTAYCPRARLRPLESKGSRNLWSQAHRRPLGRSSPLTWPTYMPTTSPRSWISKAFASARGTHCTMPLMEKMGLAATARASFYLYNTESDGSTPIVRTELEKVARVFKIT